MKIYLPDSSTLEAPVTSSAEHVEELMGGDYIRLSWVADSFDSLPVGSYIVPFDDGLRYTLYKAYQPSARRAGEYNYEPQFDHPKMILAHTPLLLATRTAEGREVKETDWEYTGNAGTILTRIKDIIAEETGVTLSVTVIDYDGKLPASASVSFNGADILSGLNSVAQAFDNAEYHIDWAARKLYFGFIKYDVGSSVPELVVGSNVRPASVSENSAAEYANCYIVKGSTRNMTYKAESGENLQSSTRLSLAQADDDEYPKSLIDTRTDKTLPKLTSILIFEDIFPQLDLYVYNVRARIRRMRDNEGNWVVNEYNADGSVKSYVTYATYYLRAAYPTIVGGHATAWTDFAAPAANVVAGKKLTSYFIANEAGAHSLLAEREFEMTFHETQQTINAQSDEAGVIDTGVQISAGDYEICFEQEGDLIIPNMTTLYPWGDGATLSELGDEGLKNDKLVLYNIVMTNDYTASAQARLKAAALERIAELQTDTNNYQVESNPVLYDYQLRVGQHVRYLDTEGRQLDTRVLSLTTKLDVPEEATITVGNNLIVGNTKQLKEEVASVNNDVTLLSTIFDATSALSQSLNRAQKEMLDGFASIKELWQIDKDGNIYSTRNVYSTKAISAYGLNSGGSGGGGVELLQDWNKYDQDKAKSVALSAYLGKGMLNRIVALEENAAGGGGAISTVFWNGSLSSGVIIGTLTIGSEENTIYAPDYSGKQDAITDLAAIRTNAANGATAFGWGDHSKAGYLTEHQSLSGYATQTWVGQQGYLTSVAYNDLTTKPTKAQIKSILGIADWALAASLSANDVPTLAISKISGLQTALDAKENKADFATDFATEIAKWFVKDANGNVYVANKKGFYSESFVSAYGINSASSGGGGVTSVKVGSTTYVPTNGVVSLPAYPTVLPSTWENVSGKPTTIAGYGITDAKIANGVITLGGNTITPLTSHQDISGKQDKITTSNKLAASLVSGLATVATSGKYSDLSGTPTIPTTLPASDVYAWAKAATKPTYNWGEITNSGADNIVEGTSDFTDNTELLTSYASNNGFADTNAKGLVHRRDAIKMFNYIKGKLPSWATKSSLAASDVPTLNQNTTGNAATASALTSLSANDNASATGTWRKVWFSYNDETTGRPALDGTFAFRTNDSVLRGGKGIVIGRRRDGALNYTIDSASDSTTEEGGYTLRIANSSGSGTAYLDLVYSKLVTNCTFNVGGNVQINRSSAADKYVKLTDGSKTVYFGQDGNGDGYVWGSNNSFLYFLTNAIERMRITSDGKVGIGTTAPTSKLEICGITQIRTTDDSSANRTLYIGHVNGTNLSSGNIIFQNGGMNGFKISGVYANWAARQDLAFYSSNNETSPYASLWSETMRITHDGNVGIGTTNPAHKLEVAGGNMRISRKVGGDKYLQFNDGTNSGYIGQDVNGLLYLYNSQANPMYFATSGTSRMYITGDGNVGIGTTSPTSRLEVNSSSSGVIKIKRTTSHTGAYIHYYNGNNNTTTCNWEVGVNAASDFVWYYQGNTTALALSSNGNLVASGNVTAYSDRRLKSQIQDFEYRGALSPKTYIKDGRQEIGFIAQEVRELYPELVMGNETENDFLSLNYGAITAVLAYQTNDLDKRVKALEEENERLKEMIVELQK